eukprot:10717135-Heterocapsa_arctica.AAC.1
MCFDLFEVSVRALRGMFPSSSRSVSELFDVSCSSSSRYVFELFESGATRVRFLEYGLGSVVV